CAPWVTSFRSLRLRRQYGQLDLEYSPPARRVARREPPAKVLHDAGGNGKPEADALARLLRRVEGLEQVVEIGDPVAVVAHRERRRLARGQQDLHMRLGRATGCVKRVAQEIDDDLFEPDT